MKDISKEIIQFSHFLNASWPFINLHFKKDANLNNNLSNWLQANWEILVENIICESGEFIELYGDGADLDDNEFSRVTYQSALPTHCIRVKKNENQINDFYSKEHIENLSGYNFNQFVSINEFEKIAGEPPFEYAELEHEISGKKIWIHKNQLVYFLDKINS